MKIFKAQGLLAVIILSAAIVGCGVQGKPESNLGSTAAPTASPAPEPTPVLNTKEAIIYLTDAELNETVEQPVELTFETEADLVKAAIAELQKDAGENALSLWKPIEVKTVELADGLVTIDIHLPDEARLGAPGEMFVIETLKKTLFQFDFVKSIELLVDGAEIETLMGHVELEHPMNKE
ncbi:GerMN domain-containing protein [Candidatus Pristimantibacillus sp. PTI5]|uniref:GerMN domain-containing protein n=1 Tax=Candidatus Pristimantibacillus sp. PTI5 TaxID=3400422 RepID=UPI003B0159BA